MVKVATSKKAWLTETMDSMFIKIASKSVRLNLGLPIISFMGLTKRFSVNRIVKRKRKSWKKIGGKEEKKLLHSMKDFVFLKKNFRKK